MPIPLSIAGIEMNSKLRIACILLCVELAPAAHAQLSDAAKSAVLIEFKYSVFPNLTYGIASNQELKLDVYRPQGSTAPTPVVILIHGGGGVRGDKNKVVLSLLPYLEMDLGIWGSGGGSGGIWGHHTQFCLPTPGVPR
jgi:predicted peptidase